MAKVGWLKVVDTVLGQQVFWVHKGINGDRDVLVRDRAAIGWLQTGFKGLAR